MAFHRGAFGSDRVLQEIPTGVLFDCTPGAARYSQKRLVGYYKHAARGLSAEFLLLCHKQDAFGFWVDLTNAAREAGFIRADLCCWKQSLRRGWRCLHSRVRRAAELRELWEGEADGMLAFGARAHLQGRIFFRRLRAEMRVESEDVAIRLLRSQLWRRWRRAAEALRQLDLGDEDKRNVSGEFARQLRLHRGINTWFSWIKSVESWATIVDAMLATCLKPWQRDRLADTFESWRFRLAAAGRAANRFMFQLDIEKKRALFDRWCANANRKLRHDEASDFWLATMPEADPWTECRRYIASWRFRKHKAFLKWAYQPVVHIWALLSLWRWRRRTAVQTAINQLEIRRTNLSGLGLGFVRWARHAVFAAGANGLIDAGDSRYVLSVKRKWLLRLRERCSEQAYLDYCVHTAKKRTFNRLMEGIMKVSTIDQHREVCDELRYVWDTGRAFMRWQGVAAQDSLRPIYKNLYRTWSIGRLFRGWRRYLRTSDDTIEDFEARREKVDWMRKRRAFRTFDGWASREVLLRWRYSIHPPRLSSVEDDARLRTIAVRAREQARGALRLWLSRSSLVGAWLQHILHRSYLHQWRRNAHWHEAYVETCDELVQRGARCLKGRQHALTRWHRRSQVRSEHAERMEGAAGLGDLKRKEVAFAAVKRAYEAACVDDANHDSAYARWESSAARLCLARWRFQTRRIRSVYHVGRLRASVCVRLWRAYTSICVSSAEMAELAHTLARRRSFLRAWRAWRLVDWGTLTTLSLDAYASFGLRRWQRAKAGIAHGKQLLDVAASSYRESVLRWTLRRLAVRGHIPAEGERSAKTSQWARRTPNAYRPFSPTSSAFDSPAARERARKASATTRELPSPVRDVSGILRRASAESGPEDVDDANFLSDDFAEQSISRVVASRITRDALKSPEGSDSGYVTPS